MNKDIKMLSEAYVKILTESISEKNVAIIKKWMGEHGATGAAYKLIDAFTNSKAGIPLSDLADTPTVADEVEGIADLLNDGDYQGAWNSANNAAITILQDEGLDIDIMGQ